MKGQYDYDQTIMSEFLDVISVPSLNSQVSSARGSNPFLLGLERIIEEEQKQQQLRIQLLKQKQQHIGEQVAKRLSQKERKIKALEEQQKQKLYAECTFKPKTYVKKNQKNQPKRSFNQFLHHQKQFTNRVAQKRNALKETLEAKNVEDTFHPKIKGKTGSKCQKDTSVFERLYALRDKENQQSINNQEPIPVFHPTITEKSKKMARKAPIEELLYGDALRRQEKARLGQPQPMKHEKLPNFNNQRYVAQKLIKEYFGVIEKLGIPSSPKKTIDYLMFGQILKEMGFVLGREEGDDNEERSLLHEAYQLLEEYKVSAKNLCVFLLALSGVYHINPVNFEEGDEEDEKEFILEEAEGRKLQRYFDLFKRNRLFSVNSRKDREPQSQPQLFSFHPQINKSSEEMAEKHREQMLEQANKLLQCYPELEGSIPADGIITHTDLLVLHNLARQLKLQEQRQAEEDKELEECTFKPATIANSTSQHQTLGNSKMSGYEADLGQKKSLELYSYYRSLQSKKQSLQASRQIEDAQLRECTFAPNLNRPPVPAPDPSKFYTKQVEETLYRMRKGREQREQKQEFLKRGQKKQEIKKEQPVCNELREDAAPTLLLDVNLGDRMDRITLYKGDENRLDEVAREFATKHGLEGEDEQRLLQLLKAQISSLLDRIDEDEQTSELEEDIQ